MDMLTCTRCDMNCPVPDRFQGLGSHQYAPCDRCQQELERDRKKSAEAAIRADERARIVAYLRMVVNEYWSDAAKMALRTESR